MEEKSKSKTRTRYKILRELGRGGMGVVYHAVQEDVGREVALKLVHSDALRRKRSVQRFQREIRALAKLDHPNLVKFYSYKMSGRNHYISMEFVDGPDLQTYLRESPLPTRRFLVRLANEIASAMDYFHGKGILHRDLKPRNVLLTRDGVAKVVDFGLAKHLDLTAITAMGRHIGTPRYMAPEVAQGYDATSASDIYQFGLILYEVATSKPAHRGDTIRDVIECCLNGNILPPCELNPTLDEDLQTLIMKCLALRPKDRFGSAREFVTALEALELSKTASVPTDRPLPEPPAEPPPEHIELRSDTMPMSVIAPLPPPRISPFTALLTLAVLTALVLPFLYFFAPDSALPAYDVSGFEVQHTTEGITIAWKSAVAYPNRLTYHGEGESVDVTVGGHGGQSVLDHSVGLSGLRSGTKYACWILFPDGTRSSQQSFTPLAASGDALQQRGAPRLEQGIEQALNDVLSADRAALVRGASFLLSLRGADAFEAMVPRLASGHRTERCWAIRVLDVVDLPRAVKKIVPMLGDRFEIVREVAGHALSRADPKTVCSLLEMELTHPNAPRRRAIADTLAKIPGIEPLPGLERMACDPAPFIRCAAIRGLGRVEARALVPWLCTQLMRDVLDIERLALLEALGKIGDSSALPAVKRNLASPYLDVVGATLVAIARIEGGRSIAFLKTYLASKEFAHRLFACDAIAETGDRGATQVLSKLIRKSKGMLHRRAIRGLGRLSGERPRACLLDLLEEGGPLDKADALLALGEGGRTEDVPRMLLALKSKHPSVRSAAALSLGTLRSEASIASLEAMVSSEPNKKVRDAASLALGRIRGTSLVSEGNIRDFTVLLDGRCKVQQLHLPQSSEKR